LNLPIVSFRNHPWFAEETGVPEKAWRSPNRKGDRFGMEHLAMTPRY
jgi:hypothetical protein